MQFVGRKRELAALQKAYQSERAELVILFGRRRVGKTTLITHFVETEQPSSASTLYWMATTHNTTAQLRDFSQTILEFDPRFSSLPTPDFTFADWEAAFTHLGELAKTTEGTLFVVLDEFTYLLRNDPAITSVLQRVWDHQLSKETNLKLVLTGSLLGMMQRELFAYQAPLYGRATTQIRLRPLPYAALIDLFPERNVDERIAIYAITGGVPAYIERFTRTATFTSALREEGLQMGSIMLTDPALILYEQLSDPQTYESILSAVASGFHQWKDIARIAGVETTSLGHYLKVLIELELVERRDPVLSKPTSKRGRYYLSDPFLRFYYRFIVPNLAGIERGYTEAVASKIAAELRAFIGTHIFETLCREWVWSMALSNKLPFQPDEVGSYWRTTKGRGVQLDVVAVNKREKAILIGECKWGTGVVRRGILSDLVTRTQRMPEITDDWKITYALFAREGFTEPLQAEAERMEAILVTASDVEKQLLETLI